MNEDDNFWEEMNRCRTRENILIASCISGRFSSRMKLDPIKYIHKIRDLFGHKVAIGGSTARESALKGTFTCTGDIDFYINAHSSSREIFRNVLSKVIFEGIDIEFTSKETNLPKGATPGNVKYYKMPHMRRRISIDFPNGELPPMDFIFFNPSKVKNLGEYLKKYQASTLSEVYLKLEPSYKTNYTICSSERFKLALCRKSIPVRLNVHEDVCTPEQAYKVRSYCNSLSLKLVEYREPYDDDESDAEQALSDLLFN